MPPAEEELLLADTQQTCDQWVQCLGVSDNSSIRPSLRSFETPPDDIPLPSFTSTKCADVRY